MSDLTKEYNRFMEWFEYEHPALYEKYARNIDIPFKEGGGVSVNNNFKLSQQEFNMLTYVARSFYDSKISDIIDIIEFTYAPDINKDITREEAMRNNVEMWLGPMIKELNRKKGKVIVSFVKPDFQYVSVDGVSDTLKEKAKKLIESYGTIQW